MSEPFTGWKTFESTFKSMTHRKWWQFWKPRWSEKPGQTIYYRQKGKIVEISSDPHE